MRIKYNVDLILMYIIVIINISIFSLIDFNQDIIFICNILFTVYILIKYSKEEKKIKSKFSLIVLFSLLLIITSSYQSLRLYKQSFWLGIRPQRHFLGAILLYFSFFRLISLNKISKEDIIKMIYRIAIIQLTVHITYYISGGKLKFTKLFYDYRYGEIRLRADCCIINLFFILTVSNFLRGENRRKNLLYTIINLVYVMTMLKTRLLMVSYLGVLIVAFVIWKRNLAIKILTFLLLLGSIPIIINTQIFQNTVEDILEDNPYDIRSIGKAYYKEQLKENPILGRGYINTQWEPSFYAAGMNKKIYLVDNGILGFTFVFGILGLIWFIVWYAILIKHSYNLLKTKKEYIYILYCVHIGILLPNIIWWLWVSEGTLVLVLIFAMLNNEQREKGRI